MYVVQGLESLRHNLLVLDKLTYDLQMEEEFSLTDVEKLNEFEKLVLLMSQVSFHSTIISVVSSSRLIIHFCFLFF